MGNSSQRHKAASGRSSGVAKYAGLAGLAVLLAVIVVAVMATRDTQASDRGSPSSGPVTSAAQATTTPPASRTPSPTGTPSTQPGETVTSPTQTRSGATYAEAVQRAYREAILSTRPRPLWRVYVGQFSSDTPGHIVVDTTLGSRSPLNHRFADYVCDFVVSSAGSASLSPPVRSVEVKAGDGVTVALCRSVNAT